MYVRCLRCEGFAGGAGVEPGEPDSDPVSFSLSLSLARSVSRSRSLYLYFCISLCHAPPSPPTPPLSRLWYSSQRPQQVSSACSGVRGVRFQVNVCIPCATRVIPKRRARKETYRQVHAAFPELISKNPPMALRNCLLKGLRIIHFRVIQEVPWYSPEW